MYGLLIYGLIAHGFENEVKVTLLTLILQFFTGTFHLFYSDCLLGTVYGTIVGNDKGAFSSIWKARPCLSMC